MTFDPPRLLPDIPADQEALMLQRLALSRRARSLIEHHDLLEANGCGAVFVRSEIRKAMAAIRAIEAELWEGDET